MCGIVAVFTVVPMVVFVKHPHRLWGCCVAAVRTQVLLRNVGVEIGGVYTHITAVTAFVLGENVATVFATKLTCVVAYLAKVYVVCAVTAVLTKMLFVLGVHNAHTVAAVGVALAAVDTKSAKLALFNVTVGDTAIGADMLKPVALLNAVLAAVATLCLCVFHTAKFTEITLGAKLKPFVKNAHIARLTYKAAFFTMVAATFARTYWCVAVVTLGTVNAAIKLLTT